MASPNLLTTCAVAFLAVFTLLGVLAVVMRLILAAFPARPAADPADAAVYAAIASAVHTLYPGASVTKLEETR